MGVRNYNKNLRDFHRHSREVYGLFFRCSYGKTSHKLPKNCAECAIMLSSLNGVIDTLNFHGKYGKWLKNTDVPCTENYKLSL